MKKVFCQKKSSNHKWQIKYLKKTSRKYLPYCPTSNAMIIIMVLQDNFVQYSHSFNGHLPNIWRDLSLPNAHIWRYLVLTIFFSQQASVHRRHPAVRLTTILGFTRWIAWCHISQPVSWFLVNSAHFWSFNPIIPTFKT